MKQRRRDLAYTITAMVLIVAAIFQVFMLFGSDSGSSSSADTGQDVEEVSLLEPESLYLTLGGSTGSAYMKVDTASEEGKTLSEQALVLLKDLMPSLIFSSADIRQESRFTSSHALLVLRLSYEARQDAICSATGTTTNRFPSGSFNEIIISPSSSISEEIGIGFYNTQSGDFVCAYGGIYYHDANRQLTTVMNQVGLSGVKHYLTSRTSWPDAYTQADIVPDSSVTESAAVVDSTYYFRTDGKADLEKMRSYALAFFSNPSSVTEQEYAGDGTKLEESQELSEEVSAVLYSNEKVSVKVQPDGLVSYVETLTDVEKESVSLQEAYSIGIDFVRRDLARQNISGLSVTLSAYETSDQSVTFYFDYVVDGIVCHMSALRSRQWNMACPIVVTVEGSMVRRYQRYVLSLSAQEEPVTLRYGWMDIVDRLAGEGFTVSAPPRLAYSLTLGQLRLMWEIQTNDGMMYVFAS